MVPRSALALLSAVLLAAAAPAQTCVQGPDPLEPNDDCASAVALPGGAQAGLNVEALNPDFYTVTVGVGEVVEALASFSSAGGNIDLYLWDPLVACDSRVVGEGLVGGPLALGFTSTDDELLVWANAGAAPRTLVLEVRLWSGEAALCNDYALSITTLANPCLNPVDDGLEPNDDCASAVALAPGSYPGLFVSLGDPDFYALTIPIGRQLEVAVVDAPTEDIDFRLYGASCGLILTQTADSFVFVNPGLMALSVVLEVFVDPAASTLGCLTYTLDVAVTAGPCAANAVDDVFEENDTCATAAPIGPGSYPNLFLRLTDPDFYALTLDPGDRLDLSFVDSPTEDIDLRLYAAGCGASQFFNLDGLTYENMGVAPLDVVVELFLDPTFSGQGCVRYDLDIAIAPTPRALGTPFCAGNPNSTGVPGETTAFGVRRIVDNDVTLSADGLPPGQFGLFVTSRTLTVPMPIASGLLCLGGDVGRYRAAGQIQQVDPAGHFELAIDLGFMPTALGLVTAMPGETWSFQAWHRDVSPGPPVTNTSNFTSGVRVTLI